MAGGMGHELQAGVDFAREEKQVFAARTAAQGGVNLTKPTTTIGTPDDGAAVDEDSRVLRRSSAYTSKAAGLYLQDLVEFMPDWKLLAGLRYDYLVGYYDTFAIPNNAAGPETHRQLFDEGLRAQQATRPALPAVAAHELPPVGGDLVQHLRRGLFAERGERRHPAGAVDQRRARRPHRLGRRQLHQPRGDLPHHQAARAQHRPAGEPGHAVGQAPRRRHRAGPDRAHHAGLGGLRLLHVDPGGEDRPGRGRLRRPGHAARR